MSFWKKRFLLFHKREKLYMYITTLKCIIDFFLCCFSNIHDWQWALLWVACKSEDQTAKKKERLIHWTAFWNHHAYCSWPVLIVVIIPHLCTHTRFKQFLQSQDSETEGHTELKAWKDHHSDIHSFTDHLELGKISVSVNKSNLTANSYTVSQSKWLVTVLKPKQIGNLRDIKVVLGDRASLFILTNVRCMNLKRERKKYAYVCFEESEMIT